MKKPTMNPDELEVDSFEVTERDEENGTARHAWSDDSVCPTTSPSERRFCY
jgi:hypothetical protein